MQSRDMLVNCSIAVTEAFQLLLTKCIRKHRCGVVRACEPMLSAQRGAGLSALHNWR